METVEKEEFWGRVVAAPGEFESLVTVDADWNACAAVVWRVVGGSLVLNGPPMLVAAWEENLGLVPAEGDGLAARKAAILLRLCDMGLPVTVACLEAELTRRLGEGMAGVSLSGGTLTVSLASTVTDFQRVQVDALLERVIPQHLAVEYDPFPVDYTKVEYLESTGAQYIDTGVVPRQGPLYHVTADMHYFGAKNIYAPFMSVLGDMEEGYSQRPRLSLGYTNASGNTQTRVLAANVGWNRSISVVNPNLRHRYEVKIRRDDNLPELYFDGERLACEDVNPGLYVGDVQYPLFLFANNNQGNGASSLSAWQIFSCQMNEDETPKFSYIPALDPTGAPCMFDLVTGKPFYNSGTGDFLYPGKETEATTYSLRRPLTYAQATAHGIRRLYHVPRGYNGTREEYAAEHGYKVLVETPAPEEGYWSPVWHEREDCIELEWVETEPPAEDDGLIF